jgi:hypothetical protein
VAEEFHSMFAVASLQALRAVGKGGIDKERQVDRRVAEQYRGFVG